MKRDKTFLKRNVKKEKYVKRLFKRMKYINKNKKSRRKQIDKRKYSKEKNMTECLNSKIKKDRKSGTRERQEQLIQLIKWQTQQ